ncbi:hypothetical protein Tco_1424272, partial [Tanacetum coccineum]
EEFNLSDKGSGGTEKDVNAAEKDVNVVEPVSTAGDAVTAASVILMFSLTNAANLFTPYNFLQLKVEFIVLYSSRNSTSSCKKLKRVKRLAAFLEENMR